MYIYIYSFIHSTVLTEGYHNLPRNEGHPPVTRAFKTELSPLWHKSIYKLFANLPHASSNQLMEDFR